VTKPGNLRSRLPDPSQFFAELAGMAGAMFKVTGNGSIPQTTIHLVQLRAGRIAGSAYHRPANRRPPRGRGNKGAHHRRGVMAGRPVLHWRRTGRAAAREAVLSPNPFGERVPDELCARASAHYDHKALWTLTVAIGQMCFFIPVALIAKPIPGQEPHWSK